MTDNTERLRTALRALMSKLADLLDEDQFAHCENIVRSAGVEPADLAQTPPPPPECQTDAERTAFAFGWWKARETASAERDELRALWLEWEEGAYDGPDLLRRVRLALHRKDGLRAAKEPPNA